MPITTHHTQVAAHLPVHHRDPMDRLIIGQAIAEDLTIVTAEGAFAGYSVRLLR
jgi:PIN domain nuclease of toxin-antitoxin system